MIQSIEERSTSSRRYEHRSPNDGQPLTVGEFLRALRGNLADSPEARADSARAQSPVEVQLRFLSGLLENHDEAQRFLEAPTQVAAEYGVTVSQELLREVLDNVLYGGELRTALDQRVTPSVMEELKQLRERQKNARMGQHTDDVCSHACSGRVLTSPFELNAVLTFTIGVVAIYGSTALSLVTLVGGMAEAGEINTTGSNAVSEE